MTNPPDQALTSTPSDALHRALSELRSSADKLKAPDNYFTGNCHTNVPLPLDILCFARHSVQELLGNVTRFYHHRWVFLLSLTGSGTVHVDDKSFPLKPSEALVIYPFQFHSFSNVDPDIHWLFITFNLPEYNIRLPSQQPTPLDIQNIELVRNCIESWQSEKLSHLSPLYLSLLIGRILSVAKDITPASEIDWNQPLLSKISKAITHHLSQPTSIKEIARELGISESHLRAKFRALTGRSLGVHLRRIRIRTACSLLLSSKRSIGEIGEACGFENVFAFSRAFRNALGISPSEYRKLGGNIEYRNTKVN